MLPRNVSFLNLQAGDNMLYLKHFLAVKIADRIQQLSRERCPGCMANYILDNFHPCVKTALEERIALFLPKVKTEALDKLENLIELYQQSAWTEPEIRQYATDFIISLKTDDLIDRRYINEDTVELHPFNMTWLLDMPPTAAPEQLKPTKPKSGKKTVSKKRKSDDGLEGQLLAKLRQ